MYKAFGPEDKPEQVKKRKKERLPSRSSKEFTLSEIIEDEKHININKSPGPSKSYTKKNFKDELTCSKNSLEITNNTLILTTKPENINPNNKTKINFPPNTPDTVKNTTHNNQQIKLNKQKEYKDDSSHSNDNNNNYHNNINNMLITHENNNNLTPIEKKSSTLKDTRTCIISLFYSIISKKKENYR